MRDKPLTYLDPPWAGPNVKIQTVGLTTTSLIVNKMSLPPALCDDTISGWNNYISQYKEIINKSFEYPKEYKKLLQDISRDIQRRFPVLRDPNDGLPKCECEIPTVAAWILNILPFDANALAILLSPSYVMFPELQGYCRCYLDQYNNPDNIATIMMCSSHICPFPPQWFPHGVNISALPAVGTKESERWINKYKQKLPPGTQVNGKPNQLVYQCLLVSGYLKEDGPNGPGVMLELTTTELVAIYKAKLWTAEYILGYLVGQLFISDSDWHTHRHLVTNPNWVKKIFRHLECMATQVDFRHFSMRRHPLVSAIRVNSHPQSHYNPLTMYDTVQKGDFTEQTFDEICRQSFQPWSPATHKSRLYQGRFAKNVQTMLLIQKRLQMMFPTCNPLNKCILFKILEYTAQFEWEMKYAIYQHELFALYIHSYRAFMCARYNLKLPPHVPNDEVNAFVTAGVQLGCFSVPTDNEEFVENIAWFHKNAVSSTKLKDWDEIAKYYGIRGLGIKNVDIESGREIVYDVCKEIVVTLLKNENKVDIDFTLTPLIKKKTEAKPNRVSSKGKKRASRVDNNY